MLLLLLRLGSSRRIQRNELCVGGGWKGSSDHEKKKQEDFTVNVSSLVRIDVFVFLVTVYLCFPLCHGLVR